MKFKQSYGQNQRIERITPSHLVIGIDMAKERHVAQATNFRGIVLTNRHLTFTNEQEGFEKLEGWMKGLQRKHRLNDLIIGMEPTGHYWFNLANWLTEKGITVVVVNPATTKRNKENRDNSPSKSDPKDALVIADVVSRGYYSEYTRQGPVFQRLRTIMSDREFWVANSVRLQNRIIRWLDIRFPEKIEKDILSLLGEIPLAKQMRSIKGLRPIFTAAILAGAGDLKKYAHGRQLLRRAGLNLAESTSGKRKGQIILSKRGAAALRKYMYLATIQLVATNPAFKQWHEHNVQNKHMKKHRSIFKLIGKLARILIGIAHSEEAFSPDKATPIYEQAA